MKTVLYHVFMRDEKWAKEHPGEEIIYINSNNNE